jgi:hypothetical protein
MEIRESRELPQGNSGDSSTPVPEGAEGICPACYHPFDSCQHCQVVGDLTAADASAVVENIAERLLAPVQRIVSEIRSERDELLAALRIIEECLSQLHVPLDTRVNYAHKAAIEAISKAEGK